MMPNLNMSADMMKNQSKMFQSMTDEQLQAHIDRCKGFNPMFAQMTPQQLRMMSGQMDGMSDDQLEGAKRMAQQQYAQNAPGAQANYNTNATAASSSSAPKAGSDVPADSKADYDQVKKVKEEAAQEYKSKNFEAASAKYYEILGVLREKEPLKQSKSGQELEMQARLNISLCKLQVKEWDVVVEQCERVLENSSKPDWNTGLWKAHYRMAQALYQKTDQAKDNQQIELIWKNAEKALAQCGVLMPGKVDPKLKDFHSEIKAKHEAYKKSKQEANAAKSKKNKMKSVYKPEEQEEGKEAEKQPESTSAPTANSSGPEITEVREEEQQIKEEVRPQANTNPASGLGVPDAQYQQQLHAMSNMTDDQLRDYCNNLKSNRAMARQHFQMQAGQGAMSEQQFDSMVDMLSPEMLRMSMNFANQNPGLVQNARNAGGAGGNTTVNTNSENEEQKTGDQPASQPNQTPAQMPGQMPNMADMGDMMNNPMFKEMMNNPELMKQAMSMMNGGAPGAGGTGSTGAEQQQAMQDVMKNPSMANLLNNPGMLSQTINMMKDNPAMQQMLQQQMPGVDPQTMMKGLEWLASLAQFYARTRSFFANKVIQLAITLSVATLVFWYFGAI